MSRRHFDRVRIDHLSPFTFEEMIFLVVDRRDVDFEHADRFRVGELTEEFAGVMNFEIDHLLHHLSSGKSDVEREELSQTNDQINKKTNRSTYFAEERRIRRFLHAGVSFLIVDLNADVGIDLCTRKISSLNDVNHHLPFGHLINIAIVSTDTNRSET